MRFHFYKHEWPHCKNSDKSDMPHADILSEKQI